MQGRKEPLIQELTIRSLVCFKQPAERDKQAKSTIIHVNATEHDWFSYRKPPL